MQASEKKILNIIKVFPSLFLVLVSAMFTFYLYYENKENLKTETAKLEFNYVELNKQEIKYQILRLKEDIIFKKSLALDDLKNNLKLQVNNSYEILESIYNKNKDKSKEEIIQLVKDILKPIRFNNNRSYIFMYSLDGTNLLHPKKKYLENKNLWNAIDSRGVYFIQKISKILNNTNETFYSWHWKKDDNSDRYYEKLGYFKKFEPLNLYIGSGEYIDDFEKELKGKILKGISRIKYRKDNRYIFIIDFNGIYLEHYDKSFIGKTIFEKSFNPKIEETFKEMIEKVNKGGDFISYFHTSKPNNSDLKSSVPKYSYVNKIDNWNWIIGTGFYMDDFYTEIENKKDELTEINNQRIKQILLICLIMTLFMLIVFFNISNILEENFKKYQKSIKKQINDNIIKDNILAHQSKMAAMGEMIGNIAHQWRQPLSTISTIVTGIKIQKELGINDEKSELESLDVVNKHTQYLSQTIDDFRDFFKPQKDAKPFLIESSIKKAIDLVIVQFNSKSIIIEKDIQSIELNSLENELIQVLINILNNARDELLRVDNHQRYIFVKTRVKSDAVNITIKDSAGGISKNIIKRIFEPYFTTKSERNGTGIGLFMVEEIVTKHLKGKIYVTNEKFKYDGKEFTGAKFTIILPLNIENDSCIKNF